MNNTNGKMYLCPECKIWREWLACLFPPYTQAICMDCGKKHIEKENIS